MPCLRFRPFCCDVSCSWLVTFSDVVATFEASLVTFEVDDVVDDVFDVPEELFRKRREYFNLNCLKMNQFTSTLILIVSNLHLRNQHLGKKLATNIPLNSLALTLTSFNLE